MSMKNVVIRELGECLVELSQEEFSLSPQYFEQGLAESRKIFLREEVVARLRLVQDVLRKHGYCLRIWDGWRSREVQKKLYDMYFKKLGSENFEWTKERLKEEVDKYVSDPFQENYVSPHLTGGAVDLTLEDLSGNEMDMGTGFDHFGEESRYNYERLGSEIIERRNLLHQVMKEFDFTEYEEEWWHFNYGNQSWAYRRGEDCAIYGAVLEIC